MIGRIVWYAVLVAIALVTAGLQIDKQSETAGQLAPLVPGPLRNYAQARLAKQALAGEDPARAVAEAELLVRRRPIPAEYLSVLAASQAKSGQVETAARTIQIAGQRGWRDPLAQEAVLRLALAAGDKPEAARRYAALFLRNKTPDALLQDLGPAVLAEPGGLGQQTIIAIIAGGDRWHSTFLRRGARVMPPAVFAQIVAGSIDRGVKFDCAVLLQAHRSIQSSNASAAEIMASDQAVTQCPKLPAPDS